MSAPTLGGAFMAWTGGVADVDSSGRAGAEGAGSAARVSGASRGAAGAAGASPRAVTRGERVSSQRAAVDWLNATFPAPAELTMHGLVALFGRMLGRPVSAVEGGGMLGFTTTLKLFAHHGADVSALGVIAYGGESQGGRVMWQITGAGCGFVSDWAGMAQLLEDLDARITRLDLAVDFLEGQHSVDAAVETYRGGGFSTHGRPPSSSLAGDWINLAGGRTLYVGKAKNGKMLRVYEKGRQLGDPESEWVRYEVQFGNRDRVIPLEALTERDVFFAGAYPALEALIDEVGEAIPTTRAEGTITLAHLLHHAKRCYGKVFDALTRHVHVNPAELVEQVRVIGLPRRLDPSSAVSGVEWADVLAHAKRKG